MQTSIMYLLYIVYIGLNKCYNKSNQFQPQNIVLMSEFPNCEIKLCDLEVSRVIQDNEHIREIIGTPDYVGRKTG